MVLNGNKVEIRKVTADRTIGDQWVVTDGLKAGDRLITQGLGKVRPGQQVVAVPDSTPQGIKNGKSLRAQPLRQSKGRETASCRASLSTVRFLHG
jgi:membrane fusion protein (multidrug efflux system)